MTTIGVRKAVDRLERRVSAYRNYLKDCRYDRQSGSIESVAVTTAEVETVESLVKRYALNLTGSLPPKEEWCEAHQFCSTNEKKEADWTEQNIEYFRWMLIWIQKTNTYLEYLDGGDEKVVSTSTPTFMYIAEVNMGHNISASGGSNVVIESQVMDSFKIVKSETDEEAAKALLKVAEAVERSQNQAAGLLFSQFNQELAKSPRNKIMIKQLWDGVVTLVPDIASIGTAVAKIVSIFS